MDYLLVSAAALIVAALTLCSGFGLGTLLMPVFALFFPVELAIAATAVVHFANNLFKLVLVGRWADRSVVLRFGLPAIATALLGALLLRRLASAAPLLSWQLGERSCEVTPARLVIAGLVTAFALLELSGRLEGLELDRRWLPLGGLLSGFFGGLSGHQGALRSAFLVRAGLSREGFVGTAATCSALVDFTRLVVYAGAALLASSGFGLEEPRLLPLVGVACLAAFTGTLVGKRLVEKVTLEAIHRLVAVLLLVLSLALGSGLA